MYARILKISLSFVLIIALTSGCGSTVQVTNKNTAPGQIKKSTGSKSAKAYAPGQQKKN
tara:strand:+ start:456 stop:632 length:177 start_codon:yes stop_codon:yes gene_type:complete